LDAGNARLSWGHVLVVLSIEVTVFDKSWALPVLFRLHRSEKRCKAEGRPYAKLTEQAAECSARSAPLASLRKVFDAQDSGKTQEDERDQPHL
jgi:hypothetical protein